MRDPSLPGEHTVPYLLRRIAATGEEVGDTTLQQIREFVAGAEFHPATNVRARGRSSGVVINGRPIQRGDWLTAAEDHYAKHVLKVAEWPPDTSFQDYVDSIRAVILDPASGIFLSYYYGTLNVGFIRRSGLFRGPQGQEWILVEYQLDAGYWVTAFQIPSLAQLHQVPRSDIQWLKAPN